MLTELSLCYSIVYHYNGAQRYEQFLQVGRVDRALILLGLALQSLSSDRICIFGLKPYYIISRSRSWIKGEGEGWGREEDDGGQEGIREG